MPRHENTRRTVTRAAGVLVALSTALILCALVVAAVSAGRDTVLIGGLDGTSLVGVASLVGTAALGVGICSVGGPPRTLLLRILGGIGATVATIAAGFIAMLTVEASVTPIIQDGCETGYVAVERSFLFATNGQVYRQTGPFTISAVGRVSADDGYQPFASGGYAVTEDAGTLTLHYTWDRPYAGTDVAHAGGPELVLPALDGVRTCGLSVVSDFDPSPPPAATPPSITAAEVGESMRALVTSTLDAAVGPVTDAAGEPLGDPVAAASSEPCDDGTSTRLGLALAFRTGDNARSVDGILSAWDDAGFEADRAIQEDIRYSETLPVQQMHIRDTTTIDGLIHMTITSACVPGD